MLCKSSLFSSWLLHKNIKGKMRIYVTKLSYSAFSIFSNVREVNLVYPIHNGSCHKQQMINNDKLNHGKPQLQLWIDSLNEMFLFRWTLSPWTMKYYFYTFKNPTERRASVREFITRQTCKICDYTVDYICRTKISKSPHAFAMCSIRTDLLKQENENIDSL
jgi:hypothetical protein